MTVPCKPAGLNRLRLVLVFNFILENKKTQQGKPLTALITSTGAPQTGRASTAEGGVNRRRWRQPPKVASTTEGG
jgi:hypothetical protein